MRAFPVRLAQAGLMAMNVLFPPKAAQGRNAFEAAAQHRLVSDWVASLRTADEEIRGDIRMLRARARELARNNPYIKRYLRMLRNNVVGPKGIRLQGQVKRPDGTLDKLVNDTLEAAWNDWASNPVTVDGKMNLRQFEQLLERTWAVDGEVFVRMVTSTRLNPYGLALQAIDADLVDHQYNRAASPGRNEIRMGVEIDQYQRPVGYWVWEMRPTSGIAVRGKRYFVPASEMRHPYYQDRPNQTRGITWFHAAMMSAHMLDGYEESEAVASRIAASKMGFLEQTTDSLSPPPGDSKKPLTMDVAPGTFEAVDAGWKISTWDPQHPTSQFPVFVKQMLRKISSALSVFYNVLANDAEQVTYSTMRSFSLIERDDWATLQEDLHDLWRKPLYETWLKTALLTPRLNLLSKDPSRYMAVRHRFRGWPWIDPEKETKAAVLAIGNGLSSRTAFLADKGEEIEDVLDELKREQDLAAARGISISSEAPDDEERLTESEWKAKQEEDGGRGNGDGRARTEPQAPGTQPSVAQ